MTPVEHPTPGTYRERLTVPLRWWVQGVMLVVSLWLAVVVAVPGPVAWAVAGLALGLLVLCLVSYGAAQVRVADGELRAGRARISVAHLGAVHALDAEAARRIAGPEADARAYLLLRPYLSRAVQVHLTDPADPTPYWLISTRHPDRLAAALTGLRPANGTTSPSS